MVSKADIVSTFNSAFNSNKIYPELDEFEKLYSLLILLIDNGITSGDTTLVDLIRLRDKTVEANQLAIDGNGQIGINNLTTLAVALNDILTELNNKADVTEVQPVTVTNLVPSVGISGSKNITTASTFEVLTTSNTLASGIYVQAKTTNTNLVTVRYLGTTDGVVLEKGQSLFFAINNSNKLEVAVSTNGEGLRWWGS